MKKIGAILLSVLLTLSAAACSQNGQAGSSAQTGTNSLGSSSSQISSNSSKPNSSTHSSVKDSSIAGPSSSHAASSEEEDIITVPDPGPSGHEAHYCYPLLTDRQKEYYNIMHDAVNNLQIHWIVLGKADANYKTDIAVVRNALVNDHPNVFWLPSYYATALGTDEKGESTALVYFSATSGGEPSYLTGRNEKERMAEELDAAVEKIVSKVTAKTQYEIELQLHDLLCAEVSYAENTDDPMVYTAYGALVGKRAVCEGYARAFQLLLSKFNIQAVTVAGVAGGEGHMWNAVKLYDEWYHVDATWNDSKVGGISHEYFNVPDGIITADHTINKNAHQISNEILAQGKTSFNIYTPPCDGTEYNYFNRT